MKFRIHFSVGLLGCCAAALYCLNASAAQPPTKTPAPSAKPDAAPTEPEIPRSIFTIPKNSKEGRDPFFPASTYVGYSAPAARTNVSGPVTIPKMVLMGISGTREKPLAIINGRTFGRGEEQEVPSATGRLRVHCIDIKEDSVIINVNGERQELRLRQGL